MTHYVCTTASTEGNWSKWRYSKQRDAHDDLSMTRMLSMNHVSASGGRVARLNNAEREGVDCTKFYKFMPQNGWFYICLYFSRSLFHKTLNSEILTKLNIQVLNIFLVIHYNRFSATIHQIATPNRIWKLILS